MECLALFSMLSAEKAPAACTLMWARWAKPWSAIRGFFATASYRGLQDAAIHPNACMLFSERQYADREKWNAIEAEYNWVPQPFDEHAEIDWSPAWSFASGSYRYIPTAYCYYGYPHARDHDFCRADSNGVAAGSSL